MEPIRRFSGKVVALPNENIDTDQIIPARFLKVTDKRGLADKLFNDWRYDDQGHPRSDFPLNRPEAQGASILLAGDNFGCGSSREHAPWTLQAYGFRAVLSTSFADIFRNNSLKNGLLPIAVPPETHRRLLEQVSRGEVVLVVDLETQEVELPDGLRVGFAIESFSRQCLLLGVDEMGYLLRHLPDIEIHERNAPSRVHTFRIRQGTGAHGS